MTVPRSVTNPRGESRHLLQHAMYAGNDVLAVDNDRLGEAGRANDDTTVRFAQNHRLR